ncbi:MAG: RDD family protein [Clostridia bacterium]|nr:RDD family protein [Clostridia bacterium]
MNVPFRRALAAVIDFAVFIVPGALIMNLLTKCGLVEAPSGAGVSSAFQLSTLILSALVMVGVGVKDILFFPDGSVGKRIMGLRLMKLDGSKVTVLDGFKRLLPIAIWPVEAILVLVKNKRLGDKWANTQVTAANPRKL